LTITDGLILAAMVVDWVASGMAMDVEGTVGTLDDTSGGGGDMESTVATDSTLGDVGETTLGVGVEGDTGGGMSAG